ncbi:hypothetical protein OIU84_029044 [Salix udensis]|uniref:Uncharacterized protein n=1 Tax=Salix udensis TaxID=889485 RepID=A0AAD6KEH2_9ROSI|nr:hypothetical protein OIU84_029044 [Salix udensis]
MNLLLKAIVMIFSASEDGSSQEVSDIRTSAVRLVSSLAQIPLSAVCFKDVLLSMPVSHKQQLQSVLKNLIPEDETPIRDLSIRRIPRAGKIVVELNGKTEKMWCYQSTFSETWSARLLPSRQVSSELSTQFKFNL